MRVCIPRLAHADPDARPSSRGRERRAGRSARPALLGALAAFAALELATCGDSGNSEARTTPSAPAEREAAGADFPEIVTVEATPGANGGFDFAVTMSSPYDTPERYADGWRVLTLDGEVLGEMTLLHDHTNEQPFTQTLSAVAVPNTADSVVVEGRDLENGYGGETFRVELP